MRNSQNQNWNESNSEIFQELSNSLGDRVYWTLFCLRELSFAQLQSMRCGKNTLRSKFECLARHLGSSLKSIQSQESNYKESRVKL
mmetsp:Transcript_11600/g.21195  ORF Transcript_11600/g.21195 Transcript_11600/m.21195 type:complete len:86 (+) Transcript_11600:581-838(+)